MPVPANNRLPLECLPRQRLYLWVTKKEEQRWRVRNGAGYLVRQRCFACLPRTLDAWRISRGDLHSCMNRVGFQ
jgi:hypothetical protein